MKRRYQLLVNLTLLILIAWIGVAIAQETITLTTPETKPSNAIYRLQSFMFVTDDPATLTVDEGALIIELLGQNKERVTCVYDTTSTPKATVLIDGLNKANLSSVYVNTTTTGTLKQRIYHRLVVLNEAPAVCGKSLAGTLTGTIP